MDVNEVIIWERVPIGTKFWKFVILYMYMIIYIQIHLVFQKSYSDQWSYW